jgi:hypothetical protein
VHTHQLCRALPGEGTPLSAVGFRVLMSTCMTGHGAGAYTFHSELAGCLVPLHYNACVQFHVTASSFQQTNGAGRSSPQALQAGWVTARLAEYRGWGQRTQCAHYWLGIVAITD